MKRIIIFFIRLYQIFISGLAPGKCRFVPTCSNYAIEAIDRFGAVKGSVMAVKRILRCHPLNPGGYDPVPEKKKKP